MGTLRGYRISNRLWPSMSTWCVEAESAAWGQTVKTKFVSHADQSVNANSAEHTLQVILKPTFSLIFAWSAYLDTRGQEHQEDTEYTVNEWETEHSTLTGVAVSQCYRQNRSLVWPPHKLFVCKLPDDPFALVLKPQRVFWVLKGYVDALPLAKIAPL